MTSETVVGRVLWTRLLLAGPKGPALHQLRRLHAKRESGYAMVVLLVSLSVMAIMATVAMPVWRQVAQREKESELVFRGEQYARAIGLFQRKNGPGALPSSVDVLVEQRYLRKKYKDPVTNDDFAPILLSAATQPGAPQSPSPGQAGRGFGQPSVQQQGRGTQPLRGFQPSATPGAVAGGLTGVTSKSKEKSIRVYKGRDRYNEWQFVFTPPPPAPGEGAPGAPGTQGPGQRGRGGQGPGNPQGGSPLPFGGGRGAPGRGQQGPTLPPSPGR